MPDTATHTLDSISLRGAGVVSVHQRSTGARFTLDSILLADFCRVKPWDRILEPGTGMGIVSLLLAKKHPKSHIAAVETQKAAAALCRKNIEENNLEGRIMLLEQDIRTLRKSARLPPFDVIVANPPYRKSGTGKQSPGAERLASRHDVFGDLSAWLGLQALLKNRGLYVLVFPADRLADLVEALRARKLEPKRMRLVYPYQDRPASLVLLECVKTGGTGLHVLPPLVVHQPGGHYSEEMRSIYSLP